jgi:plasmid stability protein
MTHTRRFSPSTLRALTDLLRPDKGEGGGDAADHGSDAPEQLEDELLDHERLYWDRTAAREGLVKPHYQHVTLERAVATATICGAADENEAIITVTRIPGFDDKSSDECHGVARWLSDLYPASEGRYWGPLQPDRVGEHLIGQATHDRPDLIGALLDGASEQQQTLALTVLARAVTHQRHLADTLRDLLTAHLATLGRLAIPVTLATARPQPLLEALRAAVATTTTLDQLLPVANVLPDRSVLLASLSLEVTARLLELHQSPAEATPDTFRAALLQTV